MQTKLLPWKLRTRAILTKSGESLEQTGRPTGAALQVGTRNTQNLNCLLQLVGKNLSGSVKAGLGISLNESLNAADPAAKANPRRVLFTA